MARRKIIYYDEVTSTNEVAKLLVSRQVEDGTVVVAETQTAGKGRLGKVWNSPRGVGIWLSIILYPPIETSEMSKLGLIASIAMCNTLQEITDQHIKIKWPNDLVLNEKKICGILCELVSIGDKKSAIIVGIGVNVNTSVFEDNLPYASSLFLECGVTFDRKQIIDKFVPLFENMYNKFLEYKTFEVFLDEYKNLCLNLGKVAYIQNKDKQYVANIISINNNGNLVVKDEEEKVFEIFSGEVSIRGIYGYT
ncbi:MAG: biotin--[acetyl-CoA-carboxylase] ligase [Epulopiscium sp. Nele67-Bin004]|nr:MAG: biotin--[acetyl-CoA-carboxylase] ligase [Epulopiscium sp. Nele67-Bin004]